MGLLRLDEYEDLVDGPGLAATMQAVASGAMETLSEEDIAAYLAARHPHRNVTQQTLAEAVDVSQAYIVQIEDGMREGSPVMLRDIARVLRVRMEDLVAWETFFTGRGRATCQHFRERLPPASANELQTRM